VGIFVGMIRRVITEGDVVAAIGVTEIAVCVVGGGVVVDAAADGVANGFAAAVGNTEGNGASDALPRVGVALPRVGVPVGGVLVCDAVGFSVVGVAVYAVTDGCADAPLGTSVAGVAATTWDVMPTPNATLAIRNAATARREPAKKRCRCVLLACFFSCETVTGVPIINTKNAFTPILTLITVLRYGTNSDLSQGLFKVEEGGFLR